MYIIIKTCIYVNANIDYNKKYVVANYILFYGVTISFSYIRKGTPKQKVYLPRLRGRHTTFVLFAKMECGSILALQGYPKGIPLAHNLCNKCSVLYRLADWYEKWDCTVYANSFWVAGKRGGIYERGSEYILSCFQKGMVVYSAHLYFK